MTSVKTNKKLKTHQKNGCDKKENMGGKKQGTTSYSHKTGLRSVIKSLQWKQRY